MNELRLNGKLEAFRGEICVCNELDLDKFEMNQPFTLKNLFWETKPRHFY
ncbi:unnamed protein product [Moneuplotes crassus]|uniref:Uncharacterized protein n=1 Tax=Euplotes crassus TaxID=5936 RepID=A0AAD1XBS1_EUPCR|nr:unnamed protein product [Moneuplotes crassus]